MPIILQANRATLFYELSRALTKEEEDRGYKDKMDRRSLKRILQQMTSDGLIKTHVVENREYYTDLTYNPGIVVTIDHFFSNYYYLDH